MSLSANQQTLIDRLRQGPAPRSELMELLWGDAPEGVTDIAFYMVMYRLRRRGVPVMRVGRGVFALSGENAA